MDWKPYSLHFKQNYEGGYRYLDKCGEFMLQAEKSSGFIPVETKPTGARMQVPEQGILASVDSQELTLIQEQPTDDGKLFLKVSMTLAGLVTSCFAPTVVVRNGFASKLCHSMKSPDAALKASLGFGVEHQNVLSKTVGMAASHKNIDYTFSAGSFELHVLLRPVTFEQVAIQKWNPGFRASATQRQNIARLNQRTERMSKDFGYALMLELDLMEFDPPENSLEKHFKELKTKEAALKDAFPCK